MNRIRAAQSYMLTMKVKNINEQHNDKIITNIQIIQYIIKAIYEYDNDNDNE